MLCCMVITWQIFQATPKTIYDIAPVLCCLQNLKVNTYCWWKHRHRQCSAESSWTQPGALCPQDWLSRFSMLLSKLSKEKSNARWSNTESFNFIPTFKQFLTQWGLPSQVHPLPDSSSISSASLFVQCRKIVWVNLLKYVHCQCAPWLFFYLVIYWLSSSSRWVFAMNKPFLRWQFFTFSSQKRWHSSSWLLLASDVVSCHLRYFPL